MGGGGVDILAIIAIFTFEVVSEGKENSVSSANTLGFLYGWEKVVSTQQK